MTVYLICFDKPYKHARHYLGSTSNLEYRLLQHALGKSRGGARLLDVVNKAGIGWKLVRTWEGGRDVEYKLKRWNNGYRLCPNCKKTRRV